MILVIGNFGGKGNKTNGQIGRTQNIYKCLLNGSDEEIRTIDTSFGIKVIIIHLVLILRARKIVALPAQRGLKPILYILQVMGKIDKTIYVAIGGWLPSFVQRDRTLLNLCNKCKRVFVQLDSMTEELNKLGIRNVKTLPNFRIYENEYEIVDRKPFTPIKLIFYARVDETKGIEILLDSLKDADFNYKLDIYGPIREEYKDKLQQMIQDKRSVYKGVITEKYLETIGDYDILVFPTHYEGEGFPGTILEAIYAGVPIIASDWKYNREIVEKYGVGLLFDTFSADSLRESIEKLIHNKELWESFRSNCKRAAKQLSVEKIGELLLSETKLSSDC